MPTKLEEARSLLEKRLEEIDGERKQLIDAIAQLDALIKDQASSTAGAARATVRRTRSRGAAKAKRSGGSRKRAPRGEREKQLLSSIKANPDYRVSDHARQVGVSPQQLYPLLNRLVSKDAIVKKDNKYAVKA